VTVGCLRDWLWCRTGPPGQPWNPGHDQRNRDLSRTGAADVTFLLIMDLPAGPVVGVVSP
jgi:hypothetical protein